MGWNVGRAPFHTLSAKMARMSADFETILYSVDGAVATITLNRPERLNTIVPPMPDEVQDAVGLRHPGRGREGDRRARRGAVVLRRL